MRTAGAAAAAARWRHSASCGASLAHPSARRRDRARSTRTRRAWSPSLAPDLLDECGVGPVCAAQLLVSSGDPQRMASEASFAALAGTSPVDASSGKQQRHRLNRGGDRQLNWALHVIALQRVRHHAQTSAYYQRLLATGKTTREARRCIKRALARHFYHRLTRTPTTRLDNIEASVRGIRSGGGWDSNPRVTLTAIAGFQDQTALAQQSHPGTSVPFLALPAE